MLKEYLFGLADLIYGLIQNVLLAGKSKEPHQGRRWLFIFSLAGLISAAFLFRNELGLLLRLALNSLWFYDLVPVIVILALGAFFVNGWMRYIRTDFIKKEGSVLLEIKLPKEILKSPLAMEIFFTALYQTGTATYIDTYWRGKVRPWFSLELVSVEGRVKFFIWTFKKFRNLVEAQLYAQYPDIEIHEAEDYMSWYHKPDPVNMPMWATYFKFTKPHVYPIKSYVDYGLHENPKEEYKIDPMSSVIEFLGSMKKGEHIWIQILIQAHKKLDLKDGALFPKSDWKDEAREEIERIREESITKVEGSEGKELPGLPNPTKGQQNTIAALERAISKWPFEAGIRGCYISTKEAFTPISITGLIGTFRQYSSNDDLNGFKLGWFTDYDYPWQDFRRMRRNQDEKEMLEAFKLRSFFQHPFKNFHQSPIILNTEELATIFHFPGSAVTTPTVERILSKRAEAPPNLPI